MKKDTTPTKGETAQTAKRYKLSRAAIQQRKDANRKSAQARRTTHKWRSAAVTDDCYNFAVSHYGSVNEALRALKFMK